MMRWFAEKMPDLDFDDIYYYIKPTDTQVDDWDKLPENGEEHLGQARASPRRSASTWPA